MKELSERWKSNSNLLKQILIGIKVHTPFEEIEGVNKINGLWDLRGISFPSPSKIDKVLSYEKTQGAYSLDQCLLESVDLSYSDLSYTEWKKCSVRNSLFEGTNLKGAQIFATDFINCQFKRANFSKSFLGQNVGENSGSFVNVEFIESNLSYTGFCFPKIESCTFRNCNLTEADFDGSRFSNCVFEGLLDSCFFRGHSVHAHNSFLWVFNRVDVKNFLNKMDKVDFSAASLFGVSFTDGILLDTCIVPKDGRAILVEDRSTTFAQVREIIVKEWAGEDKRIALEYIDKIFLSGNRLNQSKDIIDLNMLSEGKGMAEFGKKFFSLIEKNNGIKNGKFQK